MTGLGGRADDCAVTGSRILIAMPIRKAMWIVRSSPAKDYTDAQE